MNNILIKKQKSWFNNLIILKKIFLKLIKKFKIQINTINLKRININNFKMIMIFKKKSKIMFKKKF